MDSFLALIGSILIGTLVLLGVSTFQAELSEETYKRTYDLNLQYTAVGIADLLQEDFKSVGFSVLGPSFTLADSNAVTYLGDPDGNGVADTVRFYVSPASATPNPNDQILYRRVNNQPQTMAGVGVVTFDLNYFDETGNETNVLADIKTLEVNLGVESTSAHNGEYSTFFWRERITPPNLRY